MDIGQIIVDFILHAWDFLQYLAKRVEEIWNTIVYWLKEFTEWVIKLFDSAINFVKWLIKKVVDWILDRFNKLVDYIFGLVQKWIRWVYQNLSNYIRLVAEKLRLWILSELKRIYDRLKALSDELKEESKKMRKWVEGLLRKVWEEITGIKEEQKVHRKLIAGAYEYADMQYDKSLRYVDLGLTNMAEIFANELGVFKNIGEAVESLKKPWPLKADALPFPPELFTNLGKFFKMTVEYIENGFKLKSTSGM
jgi:hypothetical protein